MKTALFLGRFQPFHLGHLNGIQAILSENDRVIIVIGSTVENFQPENPLTLSERIQTIEAALKENKISAEKYLIIPVPNIQNYALWPKHVELSVPPFQKIYTGSDIVFKLFQNHNQTLKKPYQIILLQKKLKISATLVRRQMLQNTSWEKFIPKSVVKLLKEWKITERLKKIQE